MMSTELRERQSGIGTATDLASAAFLSMVLDRTTDGVLLADHAGTIVYANAPLLELFGYDAEDLIGQPIDILLPEDLRHDHRDHVAKYDEAPRQRPMGREDLDIEGRHSDGSKIPVDIQLNALPGSSLVVATVRDMTMQRHVAAKSALDRIDLANARSAAEHLRGSLDLVIQSLFGLGTSIAAGAENDTLLIERMASALQGIDEIIDAVQSTRRSVAPAATVGVIAQSESDPLAL
jgi:PAS domain S-box-containing protein